MSPLEWTATTAEIVFGVLLFGALAVGAVVGVRNLLRKPGASFDAQYQATMQTARRRASAPKSN
jgi:hypothetical protein